MIANYQYINDEQLNCLKNFDCERNDVLDEVEEWNEESEMLLDIDKMWDVLHFVLTGVSSCDPIENNPLSEAVVGVHPLEGQDGFVAYTEKERVVEILAALEAFDMKQAMATFSMDTCQKAELYPDIWDYDDEEELVKEEISDYFQNMKDFYREVLEANGHVMVTIY